MTLIRNEHLTMKHGWRKRIEAAGLGALRVESLRRTLMDIASDRGRTLILAYHRVHPDGARPEDLPPTIRPDRFRTQLEILREVGDIMPLSNILDEPGPTGRLRFAVTFDDDHFNHVEYVLPVLESLGVTATFFLSGRALHGLGAYWWEALEGAVRTHGLSEVARRLEVEADSLHELGKLCEREPLTDRVSDLFPVDDGEPRLDAHGIRVLAQAGMEFGFHTVHHPVLTLLREPEVDAALTFGRSRLADATGTPIDTFAYPYGIASPAVARRAEAAGYRAAFTNQSFVFASTSDPFLLGRWDPRNADDDTFRRSLALRLNRPAPGPQRQP